ncbi:hypothetical protein KOR42_54610 [Thalassoglobus neptunius]|uniref:Uncharacterized protein n=1 Tax=Thalassoglobus neptunius TaxID=1938619 RepID=A0A5C5UYH9_9PLAN|nr:hypothetical protein KOR42_54610 [Thalassoglobus neptunius]
MNETVLITLIAAPLVVLAVTLYWVDRIRRREALYRWSAQQGYKVLSFRRPLVTEASAFPMSASKSQHVFHVDVETPNGKRRSGWVRLGSAWLGLASKKVDTRWEAEE